MGVVDAAAIDIDRLIDLAAIKQRRALYNDTMTWFAPNP